MVVVGGSGRSIWWWGCHGGEMSVGPVVAGMGDEAELYGGGDRRVG
jgi:hypothetical protein